MRWGGPMWASDPTEGKRKFIRYRAGGVEPRPYGGQQGVRKNTPVTAAPCQPPLGKGALGTGDADCHSQCAHWLRNDREFYMGAVERADVGIGPYEIPCRGGRPCPPDAVGS